MRITAVRCSVDERSQAARVVLDHQTDYPQRAHAFEGDGWIVTLDLDGAHCVVVPERKMQLRIFREINSAAAFVERNSAQADVRIMFTAAQEVPTFGLRPISPEKNQYGQNHPTPQARRGFCRKVSC